MIKALAILFPPTDPHFLFLFVFAVLQTVSGLQNTGLRRYYFAYGSNCNAPTLARRLGLGSNTNSLNRRTALLPGYELCFSVPGLLLTEQSFATITSCSTSNSGGVWGVLYDLSEFEYLRLLATEGVPFIYNQCPVQVKVFNAQRETILLSASTLIASPARQFPLGFQFRPSSRYLSLIVQGLRAEAKGDSRVLTYAELLQMKWR